MVRSTRGYPGDDAGRRVPAMRERCVRRPTSRRTHIIQRYGLAAVRLRRHPHERQRRAADKTISTSNVATLVQAWSYPLGASNEAYNVLTLETGGLGVRGLANRHARGPERVDGCSPSGASLPGSQGAVPSRRAWQSMAAACTRRACASAQRRRCARSMRPRARSNGASRCRARSRSWARRPSRSAPCISKGARRCAPCTRSTRKDGLVRWATLEPSTCLSSGDPPAIGGQWIPRRNDVLRPHAVCLRSPRRRRQRPRLVVRARHCPERESLATNRFSSWRGRTRGRTSPRSRSAACKRSGRSELSDADIHACTGAERHRRRICVLERCGTIPSAPSPVEEDIVVGRFRLGRGGRRERRFVHRLERRRSGAACADQRVQPAVDCRRCTRHRRSDHRRRCRLWRLQCDQRVQVDVARSKASNA